MNPIIITIIIATAAFILTVFGATWLNNRSNDERMKDFKIYIDAKFDAILSESRGEFKAVRAEIGTLRAESKAESEMLRGEVARMRERIEKIERQLDPLFKLVVPGIGD